MARTRELLTWWRYCSQSRALGVKRSHFLD